jgi:hypothetical protein
MRNFISMPHKIFKRKPFADTRWPRLGFKIVCKSRRNKFLVPDGVRLTRTQYLPLNKTDRSQQIRAHDVAPVDKEPPPPPYFLLRVITPDRRFDYGRALTCLFSRKRTFFFPGGANLAIEPTSTSHLRRNRVGIDHEHGCCPRLIVKCHETLSRIVLLKS